MPRAHTSRRASVALAVLLSSSTASGQTLHVEVGSGRVTIDAQDTDVATVLQEWSRVGDIEIVNSAAVAGRRVNLRLDQVHEREAIQLLLGNTVGYIASLRALQDGKSILQRVTVINPTAVAATSHDARAPVAAQRESSAVSPSSLAGEPARDTPVRAGGTASTRPPALYWGGAQLGQAPTRADSSTAVNTTPAVRAEEERSGSPAATQVRSRSAPVVAPEMVPEQKQTVERSGRTGPRDTAPGGVAASRDSSETAPVRPVDLAAPPIVGEPPRLPEGFVPGVLPEGQVKFNPAAPPIVGEPPRLPAGYVPPGWDPDAPR